VVVEQRAEPAEAFEIGQALCDGQSQSAMFVRDAVAHERFADLRQSRKQEFFFDCEVRLEGAFEKIENVFAKVIDLGGILSLCESPASKRDDQGIVVVFGQRPEFDSALQRGHAGAFSVPGSLSRRGASGGEVARLQEAGLETIL
jgi:hypothetical protein